MIAIRAEAAAIESGASDPDNNPCAERLTHWQQ